MDFHSCTRDHLRWVKVFNWFQIFSSDKKIPKVTEQSRNSSKINLLEGGVDDFSYFQLFYFLIRTIPFKNIPRLSLGGGGSSDI